MKFSAIRKMTVMGNGDVLITCSNTPAALRRAPVTIKAVAQ